MAQRAIMVDPYARAVHEVWHDFASDSGELLGQYIAAGDAGPISAPLCAGPAVGPNLFFYMDGEGLSRADQAFWTLQGWPDPLAGRAILCQHVEGEIVGLTPGIQPEMIQRMVTFGMTERQAQAEIGPGTIRTLDDDKIVSIWPTRIGGNVPYQGEEDD